LAIQGIDVLHFLIKVLVKDWRQPIAYLMRFELTIFLRVSPHVGARFGLLCRVS
jgi:hypothetical protein